MEKMVCELRASQRATNNNITRNNNIKYNFINIIMTLMGEKRARSELEAATRIRVSSVL